LRFTDDTFDHEQAATIGVDFKVKQIILDGNNVKLAIWVTLLPFFSLSHLVVWLAYLTIIYKYILELKGYCWSREIPNSNS